MIIEEERWRILDVNVSAMSCISSSIENFLFSLFKCVNVLCLPAVRGWRGVIDEVK